MGRKNRTNKEDDNEQSELFRQTARKHGADQDDLSAADDLLGKLAKMPPEPRKPSGQKWNGARLNSGPAAPH